MFVPPNDKWRFHRSAAFSHPNLIRYSFKWFNFNRCKQYDLLCNQPLLKSSLHRVLPTDIFVEILSWAVIMWPSMMNNKDRLNLLCFHLEKTSLSFLELYDTDKSNLWLSTHVINNLRKMWFFCQRVCPHVFSKLTDRHMKSQLCITHHFIVDRFHISSRFNKLQFLYSQSTIIPFLSWTRSA